MNAITSSLSCNRTLSRDIHITSFDMSHDRKILLKNASLSLSYGRRYGLIGRNGTGKTTLLKQIYHRHLPISTNLKILYLEQEIPSSDTLVLHELLNSDTEMQDLVTEQHLLNNILSDETDTYTDEQHYDAAERLSIVEDRLTELQKFSAEKRAKNILFGLQFTSDMLNIPTHNLSGGWRMRLSLAKSLFLNPDLLLLDEPTNHLDLNAVIWLQHYLQKWKKILLLVSHDRDFLNTVCTDIIHLDNHQLVYYKGNYDVFEKLNTNLVKHSNYRVKFTFNQPNHINTSLVEIHDLTFGYSDIPLFQNLDLNIHHTAKIAIVGPNGAGKSTLFKLILSKLSPMLGHINLHRKLKIGYFSQHFEDTFNVTLSPIQLISSLHPDLESQHIRNVLGKFNLKGQDHNQIISLLSGGQKTRLALALLYLDNPHLLLLDEPTNHLDIQSVDALINALNQFDGAICLISHDQRLISKVCDCLWILHNNSIHVSYDSFDTYRDSLLLSFDSLS